jgi:predicted dehydrogenase
MRVPFHVTFPHPAHTEETNMRIAIPFLALLGTLAMLSTAPDAPAGGAKPVIKIGIIGTDTSHVPNFTAQFEQRTEWRMKVVAAFKGGSPDLPTSADRVEKFAATIRDKHGVELVDSIPALLAKVDVVLLESVDGRPHLAQVTPVFKAGKPVFIDKPLAAGLDDAREIVRIGRETGTPWFTASSARFNPEVARLRATPGVGRVTKVQASYTLNTIAFHPDLFFYGIHGIEALYGFMGPGCVSVTRKVDAAARLDETSCTWKDGRVGVYHGLVKGNPEKLPLLRIWGDKGTVDSAAVDAGYTGLLLEIAKFFQTRKAPVDPMESLEVIEFMTAAQLSKERGGAAVTLAELRK